MEMKGDYRRIIFCYAGADWCNDRGCINRKRYDTVIMINEYGVSMYLGRKDRIEGKKRDIAPQELMRYE